MFTPLEFGLKNEYQFKMIKRALTWWINNFSKIIKKYTRANRYKVERFKPSINKLLSKMNMNKKTKFPYKLSLKSFKSEQSFIIAGSDYLKYSKRIKKPSNKTEFKAVYNVIAYAYKDLMVGKAINSVN